MQIKMILRSANTYSWSGTSFRQ